jgi:hypothetical protein
MKPFLKCSGAFLLICIGFAIHPGFGVLIGMFAVGSIEALLAK